MPNRAQRRREARAAKAAAKQERPGRKPESGKAGDEQIRRLMADLEKNGPAAGLPGIRAEAEAELRNRAQTRDLIMGALEKNGITVDDLEKEFERGRTEGFRQAGMEIVQSCYAGICIALHDEFGFGERRCYRALKACDEKIIWVLHHSELAAELLEKTGLTLDWEDPVERVQRIRDSEEANHAESERTEN